MRFVFALSSTFNFFENNLEILTLSIFLKIIENLNTAQLNKIIAIIYYLLYQGSIRIIFHQMKPYVVFMLGGPGSGKGTQSKLLEDQHKFVHLSAGDLLRAQRQKQNSVNGKLIQQYIVHGKIVPSQITVRLLQQAMVESGFQNGRFLIDGFPRNEQNLTNWLKMMGQKVQTPFIVHLKCSQEIMKNRILSRAQSSGRSDDNLDSILKRFRVYNQQTSHVINYFKNLNKLVEVNSEGQIDNIFKELSKSFSELK